MGRTQGDMNEMMPAANAVNRVTFSTISPHAILSNGARDLSEACPILAQSGKRLDGTPHRVLIDAGERDP